MNSNPSLKFELKQRIYEYEQKMQRLKSNFKSDSQTLKVFFSYAHEDENLRNELAKHLSILQRQGIIDSWYDRDINAGSEWSEEIDTHLNSAQIILLLISPDFIASNYCFDVEMKRAMERYMNGEAIVIPVILRPTDWSGTAFRKLQALPKDAKPVTTWANRDEAFLNIAKGIRKAVESIITTVNKVRVSEPIQSPSQKINRHKSISPMLSYSNQKKLDRLQENIDIAQKQYDELTDLINIVIDEINENRGDAVRQRNLNKKKKRYEEERNQYDQEIEKIQAEIEQIVTHQ